VAATPAPLADIDTLAQTLALLGTVTDAGDAPPELVALHLTRTLVAAAEQQAVAAEHAASKAGGGRLPDGHDVAGHQGTYDLATAKAALTMLAVTYWRSHRLHAGSRPSPTPSPAPMPTTTMRTTRKAGTRSRRTHRWS
jgi:hypothetical protein